MIRIIFDAILALLISFALVLIFSFFTYKVFFYTANVRFSFEKFISRIKSFIYEER